MREGLEDLRNLLAEFARRNDHHRTGLTIDGDGLRIDFESFDQVQDRQSVSESFPATGFGDADDRLSAQEAGERSPLNLGRGFEALFGKGGLKGRQQLELSEFCHA